MRRVALCADDFGAGPAVDAAILELAQAGRIDAVSCLVLGPSFAADAAALRALHDRVDAGLHIDLASGRGGLAALLVASHARLLRRAGVAARLAAQLDAFESAFGGPPDFVDGHQHVHALPVVRDALVAALRVRYPGGRRPAVRNTVPLVPRGAKARLLAALGGAALRDALREAGLAHNADFAGVYDLRPGPSQGAYRARFRAWLAGAADGTLLLCHPGSEPTDAGDPIAPARRAELAYLASGDLERDCADAGVERVRFTALAR